MQSPIQPIRYFILFLVACFLLKACHTKSTNEVNLSEYTIGKNLSDKIQPIHALRNEARYAVVDSMYQQLLLDATLNPQEKEFIGLNQLLCKLISNDTLYIDTLTQSVHFKGLSTLVNGIVLSRKDRSGLATLSIAQKTLKKEKQDNSFYYFVMLEQTGLAHKQKGAYQDSITHYFKAASDFIEGKNYLKEHNIRMYYRRALNSLVHRDELNGIGYIEEALGLGTSEIMHAKLLIAKATLLRKLNRLNESQAKLHEVEILLQKLKVTELNYLFYYEQCFQGIQGGDSIRVFTSLDSLAHLSSLIPEATYYGFHLKGHYYYSKNQIKNYLECFEASYRSFKKHRWTNTAHIYQSLYALTEGYTKNKDFAKAEYFAYQSLVYATTLSNEPYTFENVFNPIVQADTYNFINYDLLGSIYLEKFYQDKKEINLQRAFRIYTLIDSLMLQQIQTQEDESTYEFLRIGHGIYSNAIETCYQLFKLKAEARFVNQAHTFMERSKSLITYQDVLKHDDQYFASIPKEFKSRELKLKMDLSFIKSKKNVEDTKALSAALNALSEYYEEMKLTYPEYYKARQQPDLTMADYFSAEANTETKSIINYHLSDKRLYGIKYDDQAIIKATNISTYFADSIYEFRKILSSPNTSTTQAYKKMAFALYKKIIRPFEPLQSTLEIIPEGLLDNIPFEALITDTTGDYKSMNYLLKQHTISYRFGLKAKSQSSDNAIKTIAAYAYFNKHQTSSLPNLPGVLDEIKSLKAIFKDSDITVRSEEDANRKNFLADIEGEYDLLHIGMHATSDLSNYLLNRIYFLSNNKKIDTVYGFEIVPRQVKAHTVVLSSCESGYGKFMPGEGTICLSRSFQQTGVENVISSLWSLPDYSSPIVCAGMYEKIKAGSSPALALTSSKKGYINSADNYTAAPFYWAGLVCHH